MKQVIHLRQLSAPPPRTGRCAAMAGFASRWWSRLTHPYTRMGLRAGRTVALGAGIFGAGYSSGVQASLEDPER